MVLTLVVDGGRLPILLQLFSDTHSLYLEAELIDAAFLDVH